MVVTARLHADGADEAWAVTHTLFGFAFQREHRVTSGVVVEVTANDQATGCVFGQEGVGNGAGVLGFRHALVWVVEGLRAKVHVEQHDGLPVHVEMKLQGVPGVAVRLARYVQTLERLVRVALLQLNRDGR